MFETPRANRLHIALYGRRNAGKSSIINAITSQDIALVSEFPGTTTDPVYKSMELLPTGPVVIIDTAGLDDVGEIGELRIKRTMEVMDKTDLALLVFTPDNVDFAMEKEWYRGLRLRKIPVIGVINKSDIGSIDIEILKNEFDMSFVEVSCKNNKNIDKLKEAIQFSVPEEYEQPTILGDAIKPGDVVLVVAPQDIQAPKGRLILPQVQVIRDILDNGAMAFTIKDTELEGAINKLKAKPDLVVTDSQVFAKVNSIIPVEVPLTSFSILMSRYKGDLKTFIEGAKTIDNLVPGDKVLIAEACTHNPLEGDIGRQKIPAWLEKKIGGKLDITINSGADFPEDLRPYKLIIHCGSCMFNRRNLMTRIMRSINQSIPITNYGMAIAHLNGILDRVTSIFKM